MTMNRTRGRVAAGLAAIWLCVGVARSQGPEALPIPDRDLGLRKVALTDDPVPAITVYPDAAPGHNKKLPRAYDGAPPLIPHTLEGFGPITATENTCLLCHQNGSTDPADPPQVPRSHMLDLRRAPDVVRETVAGARLPQTPIPGQFLWLRPGAQKRIAHKHLLKKPSRRVQQ